MRKGVRRPGVGSEAAQSNSAADLKLTSRIPAGSRISGHGNGRGTDANNQKSPGWHMEDLEALRSRGLHAIPVAEDKPPLVKWRKGAVDYVHVPPTDAQIRQWVQMSPAGWAITCGGPGRVVALDVEAAGWLDPGEQGRTIRQMIESLPASCLRPTPFGGAHAHVRLTDGDSRCGGLGKLTQRREDVGDPTLLVELRREGHYAVVLGPGRGRLPADFQPYEMTYAQLMSVVGELCEVSDIPTAATLSNNAGRDSNRAAATACWLDELPISTPCQVVQAEFTTALKILAADNLTAAILAPVMRLVRHAARGHQGVPVALAELKVAFGERVDLRGNRPGGIVEANAQWDRSVQGALQHVGRPRWVDRPSTRRCECWFREYLRLHQAARPPSTSTGVARSTEATVLAHLVSWCRSNQSSVARQSQRQISLATGIGLRAVNAAIRRLEQQGWLARHRDTQGIHRLELTIPTPIRETTKGPRVPPEDPFVVSLMNRELHPVFGSRGLGRGPAETFAFLPEYRRRFGAGTLVRVPPGTIARDSDVPASGRALGDPPAPTLAELVARTGKSRQTVRRHLGRLASIGLAFCDEHGRWWRYRANPDAIAERFGIVDVTPERRRSTSSNSPSTTGTGSSAATASQSNTTARSRT